MRLVVALALALPGAASAATVTTQVGPTRLLSPGFGYTVAYRTVETRTTVHTAIRILLDEDGRWRDVTPPHLRANTIDDVAFVDRRHGWVAAYDCADVRVYLYRTSDGGRTWQALGAPGEHSCGGGPTWLTFVDREHGWMEPVSPNGPAGELLRTSDGGRTWTPVASFNSGRLPCLAPVAFVSPSTGWLARCEQHPFATHDGGRRWTVVAIPAPRGTKLFDLPRFGVAASVVGERTGAAASDLRVRAVGFSVAANGGWSLRSVRPVAPCTESNGLFFPTFWPAAVAGADVWWIVAGRLVQRTSDAGRHWRTVVPRGLPSGPCAIMSVSAVGASDAWVVVRSGARESALFETRDGGRTWRRAP